MPLEHEFFSQEQIAALYNLAKERGIPVDSMRFNEVIDYLYKNEYTFNRNVAFQLSCGWRLPASQPVWRMASTPFDFLKNRRLSPHRLPVGERLRPALPRASCHGAVVAGRDTPTGACRRNTGRLCPGWALFRGNIEK